MSVAEEVVVGTEEQAAPPAPKAPTVAMIRTLGGAAFLSAFLIVLTYQLTIENINKNKLRAIEMNVLKILDGATTQRVFEVAPEGLKAVPEGVAPTGKVIYAGYDASGALKGVAIEASSKGYQDVVRVMYAFDPAAQQVTGFTVVESKETPGLGDKIAKDPKFLANFDGLDATLDSSGQALAHAIEMVKNGTKTQPWQIDAISGATISSRAVTKMINESLQEMAPYLAKHQHTLKEAK